MEMQEMKMTEEESQEKNKGTEERKQDDALLEGKKVDSENTGLIIATENIYSEPSHLHPSGVTEKKVDSVYTGLNIPTENIYSEPSHPRPPATSITGLQRRIHLYRGVCVILSVLSLILLIGIGILCTTRQSQTVCQDEKGIPGEVPAPKSCSENECRHVCPVEEYTARPCAKCDAGWQEFEGKCFYLSHDECSWGVCREKCRNMAGDLAVVDNQRLQEFLVKKGSLAYWIGVIQAKTGEAIWVSATGSESYWNQSQIEGKCGYLIGKEKRTHGWHKSSCSLQTAYICQK